MEKRFKKDPFKYLGFEKQFIGRKLDEADADLKGWDLEEVNPVVDENEKIVGFIYDTDCDGCFKGKAINDFGLKEMNGYWVYYM